MELIQYINTKVKLSADESNKIDTAFKREFHHRGTTLADPGNRSQKVHFIEKGMLRTFYNKDGKDITHFFFDENAFFGTIESIFFNKTDPYGRQALEDCVLRTIHARDFASLTKKIVNMKEFAFLVAIDVCKLFADRIFSLQFQNAQERYANLLEANPTILLRAPLGHIASYLGITQQTLSVIRSKK